MHYIILCLYLAFVTYEYSMKIYCVLENPYISIVILNAKIIIIIIIKVIIILIIIMIYSYTNIYYKNKWNLFRVLYKMYLRF